MGPLVQVISSCNVQCTVRRATDCKYSINYSGRECGQKPTYMEDTEFREFRD